MARRCIWSVLCCATVLGLAVPARGQTWQYRSAPGVDYRSMVDTGPVARAAQALAADPRNVERIIALGIAQSNARQMREAIATFSRGIAIAPRNAVLYRWRGHRYLSVRELARAEADLVRAVRLDSTLYGAWYHLGVLRFVQGDFRRAATAFARAQPLAPDAGELAGSTDWLWMSLQRAGRGAEADAMLARRPDSLRTTAAYAQRLMLYRGELRPEHVIGPADSGDVAVATLGFGIGNWHLVRGDTACALAWFDRALASGGWPAFGFMAAEADLRRLRSPGHGARGRRGPHGVRHSNRTCTPVRAPRHMLAHIYYWRARPGKFHEYTRYITEWAEPIDREAQRQGAFVSVTTYATQDTTSPWTHMRVFVLRDSVQLRALSAALQAAGVRVQPDSAQRRVRTEYSATLRDRVGDIVVDVLP